MDAADLTVSRPANGVAVVTLLGEWDMSNSGQLRERVRELLDEERSLVFDLDQAAFIDSTVINTLFQTQREAREHGRELVLVVGTNARVRRVLEISGVVDALACFVYLESAIAHLEAL